MNTDVEELAPAVRSILAAARDRAAARSRPDRGDGGAGRVSVDARSLPAAVVRAERDGRVPVVAEVKPTSPTTEGERTDDPVELAREMVAGGAAALSVLTEPEHFGGSTDTLRRVRDAVDVPVLRKDFIVDETQLDDVEADVVLLIVRFVGDDLPDLLAAAHERGFQVLVETHTRDEVDRAVSAVSAVQAGADTGSGADGETVIGVNNRDLARLEVDLGTFERVAPHVPDDTLLVAESGIQTPDDAARMRRAGADALLVGTAIMDGDVRANTERLTTPTPEPTGTATEVTDE